MNWSVDGTFVHISAGQEVLYAAREAGGLPGSAEKYMIRASFLFFVF